MSPAASAAWRVMRRIAPAYGRSASMRCSALRRRAAATISIARVIFWMFLTDPMRFLMSFCAMGYSSREPAPTGSFSELSSLVVVAVVVVGLRLVARELSRGSPPSSSGWPSSSRS